MGLFLLHLRRGLHPGLGLGLGVVALVVFLGAELPDSVGLGAAEPENILRGLRRADLVVAMLALLLPFSALGSARVWRDWEAGERTWLMSSPAPKWKLALGAWAGAWGASLIWLLVIAGLCEGLTAGSTAREWRVAGPLAMQDIERRGDEGRLSWTSEVKPTEIASRAHFEVGMFGSSAQVEELQLTSFEGTSQVPYDKASTQPARISSFEVNVPATGGPVRFELHAVGAKRSLLLNRPRLQQLVVTGAWTPTGLFLLRVALLLAVAHALVLGLCSWFSSATSLTYVFSAYLLMWLEGERWNATSLASWVPGFDLPGALSWLAQGRGPDWLAPETWAGTLALVGFGLGLVILGLGKWRTGR